MEQVKFVVLGVLWFVYSIMPPGSFGRPPRHRYRIAVVRTETGEVLYRVGTFRGDDALEAANPYAAEIQRIGLDDWVFKKTHGWRID